jgi:hypothetical protein
MRRLTVGLVALVLAFGGIGQVRGAIIHPDRVEGTEIAETSHRRSIDVIHDGVTTGGYPDGIWESLATKKPGYDNYVWVAYYWNQPITPESSTIYTFEDANTSRVWRYNIKYLNSNQEWTLWKDVTNADPAKVVFTDSLIGMPSTTGWKVDFIWCGGNAAGQGDPSDPNSYAHIVVEEIQVQGSVVPEPCTLIVWSLLGASGVTLGWRRRRKRAG